MERALSLKREIDFPDSSGLLYAKPWFCFLVGLVCLLAGVVVGGLFFPHQVVQLVTVEKRVEVPVDRIIEKRVEVPAVKILDRLEKVPVVPQRVWPEMRVGISYAAVRAMLGPPDFIDHTYGVWYFANSGWVRFEDGVVSAWKEPSP